MSTMFPAYNEPHDALLARVRANLPALEALQREMAEAAPLGLLRFYASDLRVFELGRFVQQAAALFRAIAGDGELTLPFGIIMQSATAGHLDLRGSRVWVMSALPVLTAFHHCAALVDLHVHYGRELDRMPDVLPAGWAALLCLYNLR